MSRRLSRGLSLFLLASSSISVVAQDVGALSSTVDCGATVPPVRQAYFQQKISIGTDYGPHYPCYLIKTGAISQCVDSGGNQLSSVQQDAKNGEMQTSIPLDLQQLQLAGFKTVRAYGDPAKVWMAMINTANATPGLNVVYQVSTCKSDAATSDHSCINIKFTNFQQVLAFSLLQLRQVIQQVTPGVFQNVVKLIIVGNEDLVASPSNNQLWNTDDLIGAINATKSELANDGVKVNDGTNGGVDLSSATVIGQMTDPHGVQLSTAYTPGAPVIENVYGAQFASVKKPADAVTFLKTEVNKMQAQYPNNPAMLGETGWWTAGTDAGYDASTRVGTLADAKAYYQGLYPYLTACSVPTLIFEAMDQAQKAPSKPTSGGVYAEQNYGVMNAFNTAKDMAMLPAPQTGYQDHPETAKAALFTFVLTRDINGAPPMTFGIQQPGQTSPARITVQPFQMVIDRNGNTTPVWPTFNLYAPATPKPASVVFLYRSKTDSKAQCTNSVASVYTTSQVDHFQQGKFVPPFSGGVWRFQNVGATGCTAAPTDVNWGHGSSDNYAQNVFLNASFSTN